MPLASGPGSDTVRRMLTQADPVPAAFASDFAHFTARTDEKAVLLDAITTVLTRCGARSVLDIGAGDGTLAVPLSRLVPAYLAVEEDLAFAAQLTRAGVPVIARPFPTDIEGAFDVVVLSHVISYRDRDAAWSMVRSAWDRVAPGGRLLIVTHRGVPDDWSRLLAALGWGRGRHTETFRDLRALLAGLGPLDVRQVITRLRADSLEDMLPGLAFVAAYGREPARSKFLAQRDTIAELLVDYRTGSGYVFPFTQLVLETSKAR